MDLLEKRLNRREFLKYSFASGLVIGLTVIGLGGLKPKFMKEKITGSYGNSVYGGVKNGIWAGV